MSLWAIEEPSQVALNSTRLWCGEKQALTFKVDRAFPLENATGLMQLLQKAPRKPLIYAERLLLYVTYAFMLVRII